MNTVYTIGYEGIEIDLFASTLKAVGIKVLADVRAIALSRKKGFSKNALKSRLEREGIIYIHFSDLGDPKPGRDAAREGRYDEFRMVYNSHLKTAQAKAAIATLAAVVREASTCLLCFERDPTVCHRSIIAGRLKAGGSEIFDLYGDLPSRYANHSATITRGNSGQGVAATQQAIR